MRLPKFRLVVFLFTAAFSPVWAQTPSGKTWHPASVAILLSRIDGARK